MSAEKISAYINIDWNKKLAAEYIPGKGGFSMHERHNFYNYKYIYINFNCVFKIFINKN